MTIREVYQRYQLKENLQQHMLRVTGVAELLCDHSAAPVDRTPVLYACLLHDLGNLVKFNLEYFPDFLQPEGLEYWRELQVQYRAKYGPSAHRATLTMLAELGVEPRIVELVDAIDFTQEKINRDTTDFSRKICAYADMRVAPHGVVSLEARLEDGRKRYKDLMRPSGFVYAMDACLRTIEQQLFAQSTCTAEQITDDAVAPLLTKYLDWQLPS